MKILILGGNRFFGKKLASFLVKEGHDVTLLNRGNIEDDFGEKVHRIKCDRSKKIDLEKALEGTSWDLVYDQICFDYKTAKEACEVFEGKTFRYIYTSSQSVYEPGQNLVENDFLPENHKFDKEETKLSNYAEAKRQAEVGFSENANFDMTYVRFPIVIGPDDYTKRFLFHVDRIKSGRDIYFPDINAKISFITSDFAAKTLAMLAHNKVSGPINSASPAPIKLKDFIRTLEESIGKKALLAEDANEENHSPYGIESDWFMDCSLLKKMGLIGSEVSDWLPKLLRPMNDSTL